MWKINKCGKKYDQSDSEVIIVSRIKKLKSSGSVPRWNVWMVNGSTGMALKRLKENKEDLVDVEWIKSRSVLDENLNQDKSGSDIGLKRSPFVRQ